MAKDRIFVGRKKEIEQFKKVLADQQGQAVLVVGQAGMGKTLLLNKMTEIAGSHPDLRCGFVRYEVTPTDSVDSTMTLMMDNAFEAAQITDGSLDGTARRLEQWRSFLNVFNIGDLVMSLRRDPARNTRDQFLERLELISKRLPNEGRAIFIIDPEKYMQKESDQSWAIVVKDLPDKIKFIFAQRPEDELVRSETFDSLKNVVRIPKKDLDVLSDDNVDELLRAQSAELTCSIGDLKKVLMQHKGHPYALGAAIDLVKAGVGLEDLPKRPEPIEFAKKQWDKICEKSKYAIRLFKSYAVLEVGVPDGVVETASEVDGDTRQSLLADKFLMGLLREEGYGKRIYHAILADYVLEQISEAEKKEYHQRTVEVYRAKLEKAREEQTKPDELAAMRLPVHILAANGENAFIKTCAYETYRPLEMLGLLDTALSLSQRALRMVERGSEEEAALFCTIGLVHRTKGNLDEAEEMHLKALKIEKKAGREIGTAREYGNLGLIYQTRGELDKAEEMHKKALEINKKLSQLEGMANQYGNLGLIYRRRGKLDKAEQMHKKALEIDKKLGLQGGIASDYGNLGAIYLTRGELNKAEEMYKQVLKIEERLGRPDSVAKAYGNLGLIYRRRGKLDKAEEMLNKAIQIDEKLGLQGGTAIDYINLGGIYEGRGDITKARQFWGKARDLYKKIGIPHEVKKMEDWIEELRTSEDR